MGQQRVVDGRPRLFRTGHEVLRGGRRLEGHQRGAAKGIASGRSLGKPRGTSSADIGQRVTNSGRVKDEECVGGIQFGRSFDEGKMCHETEVFGNGQTNGGW